MGPPWYFLSPAHATDITNHSVLHIIITQQKMFRGWIKCYYLLTSFWQYGIWLCFFVWLVVFDIWVLFCFVLSQMSLSNYSSLELEIILPSFYVLRRQMCTLGLRSLSAVLGLFLPFFAAPQSWLLPGCHGHPIQKQCRSQMAHFKIAMPPELGNISASLQRRVNFCATYNRHPFWERSGD